ncbi:SGNH/GDSL hydrolase family protein [Streptomyces iconiensis]|uniref:SGNH/GDSL hydrolase family protein n=1 Tax=Streptomyces iconiensis TaxID=1384038 RepID=A0ABT7A8L8_9ACTN|nr:SGNH/GDSL hydrolase family protein [Streptomyces iconiensis]MDJ1137334.1 SGNH/GDSL hydrolase family protein [Streptomyces iconiensis]
MSRSRWSRLVIGVLGVGSVVTLTATGTAQGTGPVEPRGSAGPPGKVSNAASAAYGAAPGNSASGSGDASGKKGGKKGAEAQRVGSAWTSTWGAAPQRPTPGTEDTGPNWSVRGFDRHSVRQVVRVTTGGTSLRIRLTNRYGAKPLRIEGASVARTAKGAATRPGTARPLRFDGRASTVLAPGAERASDATALKTRPGERLTLTLRTGAHTGPATFHRFTTGTAYRAKGDHVGDTSGAAYSARTASWYYLAGADVRGKGSAGASVAIAGDSLIDGVGATPGRDTRLSDALARRLAARSDRPLGVHNAGIAGNKLLNSAACYGDPGVDRLAHDALARPGVRTVLVHLGANDIGAPHSGDPCAQPAPEVTAAQLIAGHKRVIRAAHARGIKTVGATVLPLKGSRFPFWTERGERVRHAVNHWIRTSGAYDAVLDVDRVLRDKTGPDPDKPDPTLVIDDGVHPNDKGYAALADAVDLTSL